MASLKERMANKTANLSNAAGLEVPARVDGDKPRTAPGGMMALTAAKAKIEQLEQELQERGEQGQEVDVNLLVANPWQPRLTFNPEKLDELAKSIAAVGLMQPVLVRKVLVDDVVMYQLVAGERRWRAHKLISKPTIKIIVVDISDADMAALALVENVSRDDLYDYEIGRAVARAEKEFPNRSRMADALGLSRTQLYRYLAFSELPVELTKILDAKPNLLGGNVAMDLAKALKEGGDSVKERLVSALAEFSEGALEQSQLLARVTQPTSEPTQRAAAETHKLYAGRRAVGSWKSNASEVMVRLKKTALSEEKEKELIEFVQKLLA